MRGDELADVFLPTVALGPPHPKRPPAFVPTLTVRRGRGVLGIGPAPHHPHLEPRHPEAPLHPPLLPAQHLQLLRVQLLGELLGEIGHALLDGPQQRHHLPGQLGLDVLGNFVPAHFRIAHHLAQGLAPLHEVEHDPAMAIQESARVLGDHDGDVLLLDLAELVAAGDALHHPLGALGDLLAELVPLLGGPLVDGGVGVAGRRRLIRRGDGQGDHRRHRRQGPHQCQPVCTACHLGNSTPAAGPQTSTDRPGRGDGIEKPLPSR